MLGGIRHTETLPGYDLTTGRAITNNRHVAGELTKLEDSGRNRISRYKPSEETVDLGSIPGISAFVVDMNEVGAILVVNAAEVG